MLLVSIHASHAWPTIGYAAGKIHMHFGLKMTYDIIKTSAQEVQKQLRVQNAVVPSATMAGPMTLPTLVWRLKCLQAPKADTFGGIDIMWWYGDIPKKLHACIYALKNKYMHIYIYLVAQSLSRILPSLGFPTKGAEASNRLPRSWLPCVWCCFGPATFRRAVRLVGGRQGVKTF